MTIKMDRAREICTKSELELVQKSSTRNIGSLTANELKSSVRRVRKLRDKWRDQSQSQDRNIKATAPQKLGEANARSAEKAELFDEALGRFEKRLSKLEAAGQKASRSPATAAKKVTSTVDHRADRAAVRTALSAKAELLTAGGETSQTTATAGKKKASSKMKTSKKTSKKKMTKKKSV